MAYILFGILSECFDGNIKVDKEYKNGTKFIIDILKKERDNNE